MYEMENISFQEIESGNRLQQLAVEIITFDRQAKITAVSCAIEIGERLLEANGTLSHMENGERGSRKTLITASPPPITSCGYTRSTGTIKEACLRH